MSLSCNQCKSVVFAPIDEENLFDFQAKIHADVASLERCIADGACHLCIVLHGIYVNRKRFGPAGRQSHENEGLTTDFSLWLFYEGGDDESDDWEYIEDESAAREDAPRMVVFIHPLGSDDLCIRDSKVIAKSEWHIAPPTLASAHKPRKALGGYMSGSPNLSTGSDASMSLAESWIGICRDTHKNCGKTSDDVPVRLLRVSKVRDTSSGTIHLVNSQGLGSVDYVTLSHRWNPSYNYFTTSSNVEAHLENGMDISHLPKTFAEACVTTKKLGFDYIWIDSLCIIQDSGEDKVLEIPKMADYYQNAALNLSASTESLGALWSDRDGSSTQPFTMNVTLELPGRSKTAALQVTPILRADKSHLDYRGWILQERIFPRRTLFFDAYWLSFECVEMSASESCPHGVTHSSSSNRATVEIDLATKMERDCNLSIIGGLIRATGSATRPGMAYAFHGPGTANSEYREKQLTTMIRNQKGDSHIVVPDPERVLAPAAFV